MRSQVLFYGTIKKAQTVLACVQASISECNRTRRSPYTAAILDGYVAELEEIEADIVALINTARAEAHSRLVGQGNGQPEASPDRDVHDL